VGLDLSQVRREDAEAIGIFGFIGSQQLAVLGLPLLVDLEGRGRGLGRQQGVDRQTGQEGAEQKGLSLHQIIYPNHPGVCI
jgi:hypothetical protein